jgi:AhpD family alkylhydroperoxidase
MSRSAKHHRVAPATGLQSKLAVWGAKRQYGPAMAEATRIYMKHPRLARWFIMFNRQADRSGGPISDHLRELAILKAATMVECEFCIDIGSDFARRAGLSDAQMLALHDPEPSGLFDADELAVIAFTRAMSVTPAVVDDATAGAIRDRFGERGLIELTYAVAWENFRARLNVGLDIGPGGFSEGRVCALPASSGATAAAASRPAEPVA